MTTEHTPDTPDELDLDTEGHADTPAAESAEGGETTDDDGTEGHRAFRHLVGIDFD